MINTDKNPAYGEAIAALKKAGKLPRRVEHRQVKYLNNHLEADHGQLKRLIRPTLGFQSMRSAWATFAGFELMRMFRKGQFRFWSKRSAAGPRCASSTGCSVSTPDVSQAMRARRPHRSFCNRARLSF